MHADKARINLQCVTNRGRVWALNPEVCAYIFRFYKGLNIMMSMLELGHFNFNK